MEHREYKAGDQIHISVTKEFSPIATEFFKFCREHKFNASEVIRGAIENWLKEQKEMRALYEKTKKEAKSIKRVAEEYERSVLYEHR